MEILLVLSCPWFRLSAEETVRQYTHNHPYKADYGKISSRGGSYCHSAVHLANLTLTLTQLTLEKIAVFEDTIYMSCRPVGERNEAAEARAYGRCTARLLLRESKAVITWGQLRQNRGERKSGAGWGRLSHRKRPWIDTSPSICMCRVASRVALLLVEVCNSLHYFNLLAVTSI